MNKKGFTLIELIGIIVILALIALIILPAIGNNLRESRETLYATEIESIKAASKECATIHINLLPNLDKQSINVTLRQLKDDGLLEEEIINPLTNKPFSDNMSVTIKRVSNNYSFEVNEP